MFALANLGGADLRNARLNGADLKGSNLRLADLSGADLEGVKYNSNTLWPEGFDPRSRGAVIQP